MRSLYFDHPQGRIHALRFGHGPALLIALHGFGDRARMFTVLEAALGTHYTIVALDWPFHGQTEWSQRTFNKEDLLGMLRQIAAYEGRERFSLMAFSFGARLGLGLLPELSGQLDRLFLLSPDGIETKGMTIAIRTPIGLRRLLFRMLRRPEWFVNLVKTGRQLGLVPLMIHHFLINNLNRPERFQRTFGCWLALDSFYLSPSEIRAILQKTALPTDVFLGKNDPVLHPETVRKQFEGLAKVRVFVLDEGHRLVGEKLAAQLQAELMC